MRRRDGSWARGFTERRNRYDGDTAYVEGSAAQYRWMVPFDLKELARILGGRSEAVKQLDIFHTKLNDGGNSMYANLGNEPCLETPWIYDFWGTPYKTQAIVRRAMNDLYSAAPGDFRVMTTWAKCPPGTYLARSECIRNCPAPTFWCSAARSFRTPLCIYKPVISPLPLMARVKTRHTCKASKSMAVPGTNPGFDSPKSTMTEHSSMI